MSEVRQARAVLIAGPTASGKSGLAIALAERFGGVVINTDSMQVYRDLRLITARPSREDESRVPHRLYGHIDAAENYSAGRFLRDAADALHQIEQLGMLPIFVGGTGLYFKALTWGLAAVPPIPSAIRENVRARLAAQGPAALHAELTRRDPSGAGRITPGDRARIARALEVIEATGRPLSDWHAHGAPPPLDVHSTLRFFLAPERDELYRRIDARFEVMMAAGALDEVRALDARALDPLLPAMKAHGVPWLRKFIHGEITQDQAIAQAKRDTRRYAKRQFTWFRHQLSDWTHVTPARAPEVLAGALADARHAGPKATIRA
jgi:tRNA dimethylallyltransferase